MTDPREARDLDIRSLRRHGWTLQLIGTRYALTRERVRQILAKQRIRDEVEARSDQRET